MSDVACQDTGEAQPQPSKVVLLVEYANGAYRQYTAEQPRDYVLAAAESATPGEPRIAVTFTGNPEAGGMQVSQGGLPR